MKLQKEKVLLLALLVSSGAVYGRGVVEGPLDSGYSEGTPGDGDMGNDYNGMSKEPDTTPLDPNRLTELEEELRNQDGTGSRNTLAPARTQLNLIDPINNESVISTPVIHNQMQIQDLTRLLGSKGTLPESVENQRLQDSLNTNKADLRYLLKDPIFQDFPNDQELEKRFNDVKKDLKGVLEKIRETSNPTDMEIYNTQLKALIIRCSEVARDAIITQRKNVVEKNTQVLKNFLQQPLVQLILKSPFWSYRQQKKTLTALQSQLAEASERYQTGLAEIGDQNANEYYHDQVTEIMKSANAMMVDVEAARRTQAENAIKSNNSIGYWDSEIETKYRNQINEYVDGKITLKQFKALIKPPKPGILGRLFGRDKTQSTTSPNSESPSREKPFTGPVISAPTDGRVFVQAPEVFGSAAVKELNTVLSKQGVSQEFKNQLMQEAANVKNQQELKAFIEKINALSAKPKLVSVTELVSARPTQLKLSPAQMMDGYRYALRDRPDYVENVGDSLKKLELQVKTLFVNRRITMLQEIAKLPLDKQEEFNNLLTDLNLYQDRFLNRPTEISYKQYQKAYSDLEAQIQAAQQ